MRALLILVVVGGILVLVAVATGPGALVAPTAWDAADGPRFRVEVIKPRISRPLAGLLPESLFGPPLAFDHASPGAEVVAAGPGRLELRADGWELLIETDAEGRVAPTSRLVFPIELANRDLTLRCRPADPPVGRLEVTAASDAEGRAGHFAVEFPTCENAATGKVIAWPPAALTVRGIFTGLPPGGL